jgi:hypothetical protein
MKDVIAIRDCARVIVMHPRDYKILVWHSADAQISDAAYVAKIGEIACIAWLGPLRHSCVKAVGWRAMFDR